MARPIRVQFEDAVYHVSARGNERRPICRAPWWCADAPGTRDEGRVPRARGGSPQTDLLTLAPSPGRLESRRGGRLPVGQEPYALFAGWTI